MIDLRMYKKLFSKIPIPLWDTVTFSSGALAPKLVGQSWHVGGLKWSGQNSASFFISVGTLCGVPFTRYSRNLRLPCQTEIIIYKCTSRLKPHLVRKLRFWSFQNCPYFWKSDNSKTCFNLVFFVFFLFWHQFFPLFFLF